MKDISYRYFFRNLPGSKQSARFAMAFAQPLNFIKPSLRYTTSGKFSPRSREVFEATMVVNVVVRGRVYEVERVLRPLVRTGPFPSNAPAEVASEQEWPRPSEALAQKRAAVAQLLAKRPQFYNVRIAPAISDGTDKPGDVLEMFVDYREPVSLAAFTDTELDLEDVLGVTAVSILSAPMVGHDELDEYRAWPLYRPEERHEARLAR